MVTQSAPNPATLTERDLAILAHVLRYRMTTAAALKNLFFANRERDALKSTLRRLVCPYKRDCSGDERRTQAKSFYLTSEWLGLSSDRVYYRLTPRGARVVAPLEKIRKPEKLARPLEAQPLVRGYALLAFCCLSGPQRELITRSEFLEDFPDYVLPGLPATPYYIDEEASPPALGFLLVDYGAHPAHLLKKCCRALERRLPVPVFRQLIEQKRFVITLLTGFSKKKALVEQMLLDEPLPSRVRIEVIPKLADLMGQHDATDR